MTVSFSPASTTVNTEVTLSGTFKDNDVRAVYIDWADGESVDKEEANYQWVEITDAPNYFTAKHTYNKSAAFYPVIQTINSRGFASHYMAGYDHSGEITPFQRNNNIGSCLVVDTAPTTLMRVENTTVNAGIDNSIFDKEGPRNVYLMVAPTITKAELNTIGQIKVEIEAVLEYNKYDSSALGKVKQFSFGTDSSQQTIPVTIDVTDGNTQENVFDVNSYIVTDLSLGDSGVSRVLKFKYLSCKSTGTTAANPGTDYATNDIFNRLKIFLLVKGLDDNYYPISYVSAGMPVKSVEGYGRYISMDFSQSRTAASNLSIDNYRYDNGKMWFSPVNQWALSTDILGTETQQTGSIRDVYYNYLTNPNGLNSVAAQKLFYSGAAATWYLSGTASGNARADMIGLDDFGRIQDQYYNVRVSAEATAGLSGVGSGSSIITNQPEVFFVLPSNEWTAPDSILQNNVTDYTSKMKNNGSGNVWLLSGVNTQDLKDSVGIVMNEAEKDYILLTFDSQTNKIFFNATNYANGLQSSVDAGSSLKIAGVEYLCVEDYQGNKQNAYWKPLKFTDTTRITREYRDTSDSDYKNYSNSLARSGYLSFDMPLDWHSASVEDLCGGVFDTTVTDFSACTAAGNADVSVTSTSATGYPGADENGYGYTIKLTLDTDSQTAMTNAFSDINDVGSFKYAYIVTSDTTASGSMFWISNRGETGWDPDTPSDLYLQVGTITATPAFNEYYVDPLVSAQSGYVRRINIYDVATDASKVFRIHFWDTGSSAVAASGAQLPTTGTIGEGAVLAGGADTYRAHTDTGGPIYTDNNYNLDNPVISGSSWATNAKYLLKVTLSGATGAGSAGNYCPELWNIFDGNQGDSAIIKEIDDSAYNLNSLPITSDIRTPRGGNFFKAITRKGRVFIVKTGITMSTVGFSSVALGDENSATAFADQGPSTLYGHLHMMRKLQASAVPVYWDEPQKDGTFVRLWGIVTDINESYSTAGPRRVVNYTFNMVIKEIALLSNIGELMTDIFPLGGLEYERDYS